MLQTLFTQNQTLKGTPQALQRHLDTRVLEGHLGTGALTALGHSSIRDTPALKAPQHLDTQTLGHSKGTLGTQAREHLVT